MCFLRDRLSVVFPNVGEPFCFVFALFQFEQCRFFQKDTFCFSNVSSATTNLLEISPCIFFFPDVFFKFSGIYLFVSFYNSSTIYIHPHSFFCLFYILLLLYFTITFKFLWFICLCLLTIFFHLNLSSFFFFFLLSCVLWEFHTCMQQFGSISLFPSPPILPLLFYHFSLWTSSALFSTHWTHLVLLLCAMEPVRGSIRRKWTLPLLMCIICQ